MKRIICLGLLGFLMGGCAVYADPYPHYGYPGEPAVGGVYVVPPPVVVRPGWEWHRGHWHEGWHRRG